MPTSSPRLKIIAIGFNMHGTGLTRVMHSIMRRLADRHEIHYLGIGYSGETVQDRGLTIHPTNPKGGDVFAAFQAKRMIEEINPDVIFILHDIWVFEYYLGLLGPYRDRLKIVGYIPLDGNIIDEENAAALEGADRVVVYTQFARKEFEGAFERLRNKRGGEFPAVDVIPHGIDATHFYPFPELLDAGFASPARAAAKRKVFGDFPDIEDSFIVLNASRPDGRKRIDLTIEGFAKFAVDKPANVRLCLHHAIMGEPEQNQIDSMTQKFGIEKRLHLNPFGGGVVDDEKLNLLYNACDVGINTSMGEGWGLFWFEHGGCGAAQVVPRHSACAELWHDRAEMIEPVRRYIPEFTVLEMGEVSVDGVAQALNNLYYDPVRREKLGQAAFENAQKREFSWDAIPERFNDLFIELTQF
ncbi:MAG TPA: glycosyltransferase family 4 protein [Pyrinomonadaceae bacterium]|nr:glycosyltransferase family 4 protein [Pyrinomonadaceae bacterium]